LWEVTLHYLVNSYVMEECSASVLDDQILYEEIS